MIKNVDETFWVVQNGIDDFLSSSKQVLPSWCKRYDVANTITDIKVGSFSGTGCNLKDKPSVHWVTWGDLTSGRNWHLFL